jgi:hypothetical protein
MDTSGRKPHVNQGGNEMDFADFGFAVTHVDVETGVVTECETFEEFSEVVKKNKKGKQ